MSQLTLYNKGNPNGDMSTASYHWKKEKKVTKVERKNRWVAVGRELRTSTKKTAYSLYICFFSLFIYVAFLLVQNLIINLLNILKTSWEDISRW